MAAARLPTLIALTVALSVLAGCLGGPAQLQGAAASGGTLREFDLYVKAGVLEPEPGVRLFALSFVLDPEDEVTVPAPELRVREGDLVRVRLHADHHTIHWHGLSVPWAMDGVPFMTQGLAEDVTPDHVYTYEFVARETGSYWYHCHVDAPVHVDLGMFGAFIVEPRDPAADPPFDREATLFLHETDAAGSQLVDTTITVVNPAGEPGPRLAPPRNPADVGGWAEGNLHNQIDILDQEAIAPATGAHHFSVGPRDHYPFPSTNYQPRYDTFMINGKVFPHTEPIDIRSGETIRLRLVNAGQLVHTMHLHGHHGLVTHKDGYKLASPYYVDTLGMFPGERYDVYVKADNPGVWDLHDHGGAWGVGAYAATDHAFPGGMNTMLVYEDFEVPELPVPVSPGGSPSASRAPAVAPAAPHAGHVPPAEPTDPVTGLPLR